jgi:hypothetical protein
MSQPIPIASFDHLPPAQTLARELSAKGFEAGVLNETAEQALKFFTATPRAQFRVTVPPDRMEDALRAFASLEPLPPERARECPLRQVIRCPECGSTIVEYPQFSRNTIVGALPAVAAAVGIVEPEFFCKTCHLTWAPKPTDAPPVADAIS